MFVMYKKTISLFLLLPAVCCGFIPTPSSVMIADVAGGTLNSSAANFNTAVKGVCSGTLNLEIKTHIHFPFCTKERQNSV